ncbi:hypothetical protein GOBAR_DD07719 [Gossypium barbadense]|nr:hypothetical protein GOBAR_DD07719 [Gossypium barbadense]
MAIPAANIIKVPEGFDYELYNRTTSTGFWVLSLLVSLSRILLERCAGADTVALVARILHRSRTNLQSLLLKSNTSVVEDFFVHLCYV